MAVVHGDASLAPTKPELVAAWLPTQPWARGLDGLAQIGAYRFDDPDGEVGIEALLFRAGDRLLHLPLTYRGAPLVGAEEFLLGTIEHTALGTRWIYDACADPVAVRAYLRVILTGDEQAPLDVEKAGEIVERREPTVRVKGSGSMAASATSGSVSGPDSGPESGPESAAGVVAVRERGASAVIECDGHVLVVPRVLPAEVTGRETLAAVWDGGEGVVAAVR
ncbi:hypothetical protein JCM18899A_33520 [Nocardioides sp. AN3]